MKVLMIAATPFFADRGCHVHIAEQARALQQQGLDVKIVTYNLGRDVPGLSTIRTVRFPWHTKLGPGPSWHKFYIDLFLLFTTIRAARRWRPDIIHGHLHEGLCIGWVTSRLLGIPFIFDCQGSLTGELLAHRFPLVIKPLDKAWYALERWLDHRSDMVLVQSTEMRQEIAYRFGISDHKIVMAYDGVNTSVFKPGQRDPVLVRQLGIPPEKKVIVYLGGLSPHKGVDILLQAFPLVLRQVPEAYLLLMGYPHEEEYRSKISAMGLEGSAQVLGRVPYEEAPRYLTLGTIAVAPKRSQTEANGKIYHYMACGLPTVAFDTVVNRDILGDLGVYVSQIGNPSDLADAMVKLLTNPGHRDELARQVRQQAYDHYSWDKVAQRIITAYTQAIRIHQVRRLS